MFRMRTLGLFWDVVGLKEEGALSALEGVGEGVERKRGCGAAAPRCRGLGPWTETGLRGGEEGAGLRVAVDEQNVATVPGGAVKQERRKESLDRRELRRAGVGASSRRLRTVWADGMHLFKQISGVSDSRAWSSSVA